MDFAFAFLLANPTRAFFTGSCFALGLVTASISFIFFYNFRYKALLYFGLSMLLANIVFGLSNQDPLMLFDLKGDPVFLRLLHIMVGLNLFFFYRLVISAINPLPSHRYFPSRIYHLAAVLALVMRVAAIITLSGFAIRMSAFFTVTFLIATFAYGLAYNPSSKSARLVKVGCCLFSFGVMIYPSIRSGLITPEAVKTPISFIYLAVFSLFSTLWLVGLIELARELFEKVETMAIKSRARAYIQLRDLMNTPLQIIEFSTALLRGENKDRVDCLERIESALIKLRQINSVLERYEKDVDWKDADDFLDDSDFKGKR